MSTKTLLISSVLSVFLMFMAAGRCPADVTEQLKQAGDYVQNKQYQQAEAIYQQILTDYPASDYALQARKQLTILYIKQDNQPQADAAFQKLLADFYLHNDIAKAVNKVADHYGWSGKYEKAKQLYQYVVGNWPQADYAIWSQKSLAASNMRLGDDPNADAAIEKLLTDFSRHKQIANAVNMLADECTTLKRYDKARELYQYVADNCPENELAMWAQQGVAILNIKLRDYDAAQEAVEKLLTDFSEHKQIAKAVNKVADHYRWSKRYEKARWLYQYVVDNWPGADYAIWSQKSLVISYIQFVDDPNADAAIEKLLAGFSENKQKANAVKMLADECSTLKRYKKARRLYQYFVESFPDSDSAIWAQQGVAVSNIKLRDDDAAQYAVEKLITDFSEHKDIAKAVNKAADHYRWSKKYEEARRLYQYVVDNWPQAEYAIWSQKSLAVSNMRLGDDPNADAAVEKLLSDYSEHKQIANAVNMLADEFTMLNRFDKARELYQYIIDHRPEDKSTKRSEMEIAKTNVLSLIKSGDDTAAQEALDTLIADFNDHPELAAAIFQVGEKYYNKALSYKKNKLEPEMKENFEKTIAVWERVITDLPISVAYTPRFYYITAVIYSQEMGEYLKGIEYYQKVVDNWPDYEFAWHAQFFVGMYYEKLRNAGGLPESEANSKIEQAYKAVLEKYPDSESAPYAALKLGYLNFDRHKWPDVAHYFEVFVQKDDGQAPNFLLTNAFYYLGQAYEQLNEFDKAIAIYNIFLQIVDPDDSRIKIVMAKLEKLEGENK